MTTSKRPATGSFPIYAWGVLLYHLAVIVWGAFVRATGSGAGCGEHWPLCNGVAIPHSPTVATMIEFSHRLTSGLALTLAIGLLVFAYRKFPRRHLARRAAVAAVVFELMEAIIGAALVLLGQTAKDTSTGRGFTLSIHLINTLLLVAALAIAAWAGNKSSVAWRIQRSLRLVFALVFAGFLLVGVSGTIAALGDTLFRVTSFSAGLRQDFGVDVHPFLRLRIWHPVIAAALSAGAALLAYTVIVRQISAGASRFAYIVLGLVVIQLGTGMINLALLAPVPLQLLHLFLADALWITLVLLGAETLLSSAPGAAGAMLLEPELVSQKP